MWALMWGVTGVRRTLLARPSLYLWGTLAEKDDYQVGTVWVPCFLPPASWLKRRVGVDAQGHQYG